MTLKDYGLKLQEWRYKRKFIKGEKQAVFYFSYDPHFDDYDLNRGDGIIAFPGGGEKAWREVL